MYAGTVVLSAFSWISRWLCRLGYVLQDVAGPASQLSADRLKCREPYGPDLSGLEDGEVGHRNAHSLGKFGKRDFLFDHDTVKSYDDRHVFTPTLSALVFLQFHSCRMNSATARIMIPVKMVTTPGAERSRPELRLCEHYR
jgi:hypothetical protein